MLGGLGIALIALYIPWPHWSVALISCTIGAALFGAAWAYIPAILQATRGSHIVITTIMFNLHRICIAELLIGGCDAPCRFYGPSDRKFSRGHASADIAHVVGTFWDQIFKGGTSKCQSGCSRFCSFICVVPDLAHTLRL